MITLSNYERVEFTLGSPIVREIGARGEWLALVAFTAGQLRAIANALEQANPADTAVQEFRQLLDAVNERNGR